jgi:hypothetical protein
LALPLLATIGLRQKCLAVTNTVKPGTNGVFYKLKSFMTSFAGGGQNLSMRPWQKKIKKIFKIESYAATDKKQIV